MTKIYATLDFDSDLIAEEAQILAFDDRASAEAYLRAPFDPNEWDVAVEAGSFADCWIKLHSAPDFSLTEPFSADDLIVQTPGQHPGGKRWWITPRCEVLVPVLREVSQDTCPEHRQPIKRCPARCREA